MINTSTQLYEQEGCKPLRALVLSGPTKPFKRSMIANLSLHYGLSEGSFQRINGDEPYRKKRTREVA